jgi:hypothetical protein
MRSGHEYIIVVMRESESEWVMSETKKLCLVMSLICLARHVIHSDIRVTWPRRLERLASIDLGFGVSAE